MAYSSGSRGLFSEVLTWAIGGVTIAAGIYFQDDLRQISRSAIAVFAGQPDDSTATQTTTAEAPRPRHSVQSAPSRSGFERTVELTAERHGHFLTTAYVNDRPIEVMVDTGASIVALSAEDAAAIGIRPSAADFTHRVSTANGTARVAIVTLDSVRIGDITVRDVRAAVSEPGALSGTLLGMSFLSKLKVEIGAGRLVLRD